MSTDIDAIFLDKARRLLNSGVPYGLIMHDTAGFAVRQSVLQPASRAPAENRQASIQSAFDAAAKAEEQYGRKEIDTAAYHTMLKDSMNTLTANGADAVSDERGRPVTTVLQEQIDDIEKHRNVSGPLRMGYNFVDSVSEWGETAVNVMSKFMDTGVYQALTYGSKPPKPDADLIQRKNSEWHEFMDKVNTYSETSDLWQTAGNAMGEAVKALPEVLAAFYTGGASLGARTAGMGAKAAAKSGAMATLKGAAGQTIARTLKNPVFWMNAVPKFGQAYGAARASGADEVKAMTSALLYAVPSAAVSVSFGTEAMNRAMRGFWGTAGQFAWRTVQEGGEAAADGLLFDLSKKLYDADGSVVDGRRLMERFLYGSIAGAVKNTAMLGLVKGGQALDASQERRQAEFETTADRAGGTVALREAGEFSDAFRDAMGMERDAVFKGMEPYAEAVKREPAVTKAVKEISQKVDMEPVGLEYRVKSEESYQRKIESREEGYQAKDILRYTYTAEPEDLAVKTKNAIAAFEEMGYTTLEVKNYWLDDFDPYNGINTTLVSPDGQIFEMQYHTPESFALKNGRMHELYEQARLIEDIGSSDFLKLRKEMFELSKRLNKPQHIEEVK